MILRKILLGCALSLTVAPAFATDIAIIHAGRLLAIPGGVVTTEQIKPVFNSKNHIEAIVIRTLPNDLDKINTQYSNTNPAYVEPEAITFLIENGIVHFLIDLPSVDKELDDGKLVAHRAFWEYPNNTNFQRTITELTFVHPDIDDGDYLLNLQIASFHNDASPSKPVLYKIL